MLDYSKIGKPREKKQFDEKPNYPKFTVGEYELEFETLEEAKGTKYGDFLFLMAKVVSSTGKAALPAGTVGKWSIKLTRPPKQADLVLEHVENLLEALNGGPGFDGELLKNLLANPAAAKGTKFNLVVSKETSAEGLKYDKATFEAA